MAAFQCKRPFNKSSKRHIPVPECWFGSLHKCQFYLLCRLRCGTTTIPPSKVLQEQWAAVSVVLCQLVFKCAHFTEILGQIERVLDLSDVIDIYSLTKWPQTEPKKWRRCMTAWKNTQCRWCWTTLKTVHCANTAEPHINLNTHQSKILYKHWTLTMTTWILFV